MKNKVIKLKFKKYGLTKIKHISIQMMRFPKLFLNLDLFNLEKTNGHFST